MSAEKTPLLSIVIPTYRRAQYLREMLNSIIGQALQEPDLQSSFEVVVVDNGMDEATQLLMENMCAAHPFISYVRRLHSVPMEESILAAKYHGRGMYLWTLGDDDALEAGALSAILEHIRQEFPEIFLVAREAWTPDLGRRLVTMHGNYPEDEVSFSTLLQAVQALGWGYYFVYLGASVFRKDKFRAVNEASYLNSPHSFSFCVLEAFHDIPCRYLKKKSMTRYRTENVLPYSESGLSSVTIIMLYGFLHLKRHGIGSWHEFLSIRDIIFSNEKLVHLKIHSLAVCMLSNQWDRVRTRQPILEEEWDIFQEAYVAYGNEEMHALLSRIRSHVQDDAQSERSINEQLGVILIKENLDRRTYPRNTLQVV